MGLAESADASGYLDGPIYLEDRAKTTDGGPGGHVPSIDLSKFVDSRTIKPHNEEVLSDA